MRALMGRHNDKRERLAAKQLWSDVINALARVYCYFLRATKAVDVAAEEDAKVVSSL